MPIDATAHLLFHFPNFIQLNLKMLPCEILTSQREKFRKKLMLGLTAFLFYIDRSFLFDS